MRVVSFSEEHAEIIERFQSHGASAVAIGDGAGAAHVYCLYFAAGGSIGQHPAGFDQLFLVVQGEGWAEGAEGRVTLRQGEGVYFAKGETHAKGSDTGMTAVMIQVDQITVTAPTPETPKSL